MRAISGQRLAEILGSFNSIKIAVVGDYFLDKWLLIDRTLDEASLETNLTAYQVTGKRLSPGASGTVINNLCALGIGTLYAVGFVGDDGEGYELIKELKRRGVNTDYLIKSTEVFTPTYTKPMFVVDGSETETNRLDIKNSSTTPSDLEDSVIENIRKIAPEVDAIIALDQLTEENHGVLTERVRHELAGIAKQYLNLIIYADSRAYIHKFHNCIVKCNHREALKIFHPGLDGEGDLDVIKQCLLKFAKITGHRVFITCGDKGVLAMNGDSSVELVEAVKVEGPIDICGAGDACSAGIVSSLCAGADAFDAAFVGNLVSSITIQQLGTTGTATREQIMARYKESFGG